MQTVNVRIELREDLNGKWRAVLVTDNHVECIVPDLEATHPRFALSDLSWRLTKALLTKEELESL